MNRLRESMEKDQKLQDNEHSRGDAMGKRIRVTLWTTVPKSIAGTIVRAEKVVSKVEKVGYSGSKSLQAIADIRLLR